MRFFAQISWGAILLLALTKSAGALDWKTTTLAVKTAPFQTEQEVVFDFTNSNSKSVNVSEVITSCGCVLAHADRKTYAPGATGKITATFTVGDRGGLYERTITVITDEADSPAHLMLKVEVPNAASISPRSVTWHSNDKLLEKIFEIRAEEGLEIVFSRAEPTNDAYVVSLESVEAGKRYRLHVKPRTTDVPVSAAIRIYGREKSGHDILISAYVNVQ